MATSSTNGKKKWEKPSIQTLDINKDTYSAKRQRLTESSKLTFIENFFREIPS